MVHLLSITVICNFSGSFLYWYIMYVFLLSSLRSFLSKSHANRLDFFFFYICRSEFEYAMRKYGNDSCEMNKRIRDRSKTTQEKNKIICELFWYLVWLQQVFIATKILQVWTNRHLSPTTKMLMILWWSTIPRAQHLTNKYHRLRKRFNQNSREFFCVFLFRWFLGWMIVAQF